MITTALVHSDAYGRFDYGPEHPLRMERLGLTWRLMEAYGLTTLPNVSVRAPEPATERALALWHTPDYLDVLKAANGGVVPEHAARCGLGPGDNPVFRGLWDAARLCAGGSLLAAELVASGKATRAFHFAGGLHHAWPGRASGFCYVSEAGHKIDAKPRILRVDVHTGRWEPFYELPVFTEWNDRLFVRCIPPYIWMSQRHPEAPRLTPVQTEALQRVVELADDPRHHVLMDLQPGDMQFINNFHVLHGRTAYEDDPAASRVRHLKRLWLETKALTSRPPYFAHRSHWEAKRSASRLRVNTGS